MAQETDVEQYLSQFEGEAKRRLEELRKLIKSESPDAVESYSYGLIGYKLNSKPLVYIGGFTKHTGLYATPNGHEAFKKEFSVYKQGKGSVQIPHNQPLPTDLIRRVVQHRNQQVTKVA